MREPSNPNIIGMIYQVNEEGTDIHSSHIENRIRGNDVLLCLEHTGDAHYTWALLEEARGNNFTRYFNIEKIYSSYVVTKDCKKLLKSPLTNEEMLSAVCSMSFSSRAGITVPRPPEEIEELERTPCPFCGHVK